MLAILVLGGLGVVVLTLLMIYYYHTESGRQTMAKYNSPEHEEPFQAASPDYNPETGQWEDWDGTSLWGH